MKNKIKQPKAKKKTSSRKTKEAVLTHEKYDRDDMVEIKIEDLDATTHNYLHDLMMKGSYGSISEVIRDIFRRQMLGDPPPRALPKLSKKEFASRLGFK